jgi:hypothetical protein
MFSTRILPVLLPTITSMNTLATKAVHPPRYCRPFLAGMLVVSLWSVPCASAVTVDFEGFADTTPIINQYAPIGVTFLNATVIKAGFSLNEFEFPALSGQNVIFDDGGFVTGLFTTPTSTLSIHVTYTVPVTLVAFDASNVQVGSVTSLFAQNFASSGNAPNELLSISFGGGISSFRLQGDATGQSFVADNLTFGTATTTVPDTAGSFGLLLVSVIGMSVFHRAGLLLRRPASFRALS